MVSAVLLYLSLVHSFCVSLPQSFFLFQSSILSVFGFPCASFFLLSPSTQSLVSAVFFVLSLVRSLSFSYAFVLPFCFFHCLCEATCGCYFALYRLGLC